MNDTSHMNDNEKKLLRAAKVGDVEEVRALIDAGVDVNAKDDDNEIAWVPLLLASRSGHAHVVQLLLQRGADVNAKSNSEQTALHGAAWNGHQDVAKVLLQHGADVNAKNKFGQTPLHWAAHYAHAHIVKLLLQHGADMEARNENGETAVDKVKAKANKPRERGEILRLLQEKTADTLFTIFFCKNDTADLAEWFQKMVQAIENVHECKIFYTIVRTAVALQIINAEAAQEWVEKAMDRTAATCSAEGSLTIFHSILCKAYQDQLIDQDTFAIFDEFRRSTTRSIAEFSLDMRSAIQKNSTRINGLEGTLRSIQMSIRFFLWKMKLLRQATIVTQDEDYSNSAKTKSTQTSTTVTTVAPTARQFLRMKLDAMVGLIGGILNAILLGRENDAASFAHLVQQVVDFGDAWHVRSLIEAEFVQDRAASLAGALNEGMQMAQRIMELPVHKSSTSRGETAVILETALGRKDPLIVFGLTAVYLIPEGSHAPMDDSSLSKTGGKTSEDQQQQQQQDQEMIRTGLTETDDSQLSEALELFRDAILSEEDEVRLDLHAAVKFGDVEALDKALQDAVANDTVNETDSQGRTALDLAGMTGQMDLVTRIHKRGGQSKALKSWARLRATARKRQPFSHLYAHLIKSPAAAEGGPRAGGGAQESAV